MYGVYIYIPTFTIHGSYGICMFLCKMLPEFCDVYRFYLVITLSDGLDIGVSKLVILMILTPEEETQKDDFVASF